MRDFRLFQGGVFTSILVFNMLSVANGWFIYDQTHNPMDLGWVGLCQFVPAFCMTFLSGQLADRHDRRNLMVAANLLMAFAALFLWWLAGQPFSKATFLLTIGLVAVARSLEAPAAASFLPDLVEPHNLTRGVAWNSSVKQISKLAGPGLGGLLYGLFGRADKVFLVCACGSLVAAGFVLMMKPRTANLAKRVAISWASFKEGVGYVVGNRVILGAVSLDMVAVLLGGAVALLPVFAKDILHVGPFGLGLLRSAPGVGAFFMAVWLSRHPVQTQIGRKLLVSVAAFGLATIVFGISTTFWLSLVTLFLVGATDNVSVVLRQSLVQIATPQGLRGRVSAVNQAFVVTSNQLGEFESGLTAAWFGAVPAVLVGGIGTCLVALLWPKLFPALPKLNRFKDLAENRFP